MRAYVVREPGGPDVLEPTEVPDPAPRDGWVSIDIAAFGLNRAEAVTRAGGSGDAVPFPRIIGIECVGTVTDAGGTDLAVGTTVAAAMGGLGRAFDGSYATKTLVPRANVFPVTTSLPWPELAALPETFFTAWGCLAVNHALTGAPRVVVRPGASALSLAIVQIVNHLGGEVVGVTRSPGKVEAMTAGGMAEVVVSAGPVAEEIRRRWPEGPTAVVDTVASDLTVADDLDMLADGGRICLAGSLADSYGTGAADEVGAAMARPDVDFYSSETLTADRDTTTLQTVVDRVQDGQYRTGIDRVIGFDELPAAHVGMEANEYCGKVVVSVR